MASFWEAQTQPSLYGYRPNASIRDLILMGGQERAQAADRSAAIWMHTLNNVGQQVAQGVQAYGEQKQMAKRDAATVALAQNWQGDPNELYKGLLQIGGPDYAEKHAPAIMAFHSKPAEDPKTELQNMYVAGKTLTDDKISPEAAQIAWKGYVNRFGPTLVKRGLATPEMLQGDWTPEHKQVVGNVINGFGELLGIKPEKPESKVVGAGEKLIGPKGEVLYAGEPKPAKPLTHVELGDRVNFYDENNNLVKTEMKGVAPRDPNVAANLAATREDARLDKSYQYNRTQLETLRKPIIEQVSRFNKLAETVDERTPQADALIAPELLIVMAGGAGSGNRINTAELKNVLGGRSHWQSLEAAVNKWKLDPSQALSVTDEQRADIKKLMAAAATQIQDKAKALDEASQGLVNAKTVDEHRRVMDKLGSTLMTPTASRTVVRRGKDKTTGRVAVQYSDGTVEYE